MCPYWSTVGPTHQQVPHLWIQPSVIHQPQKTVKKKLEDFGYFVLLTNSVKYLNKAFQIPILKH